MARGAFRGRASGGPGYGGGGAGDGWGRASNLFYLQAPVRTAAGIFRGGPADTQGFDGLATGWPPSGNLLLRRGGSEAARRMGWEGFRPLFLRDGPRLTGLPSGGRRRLRVSMVGALAGRVLRICCAAAVRRRRGGWRGQVLTATLLAGAGTDLLRDFLFRA